MLDIKKNILTKKARSFTDVVDGFTEQLEDAISRRSPDTKWINLDRVTKMPTYQFAVLALENNAPTQVIKTIQQIRKRYEKIDNIDSQTLGFLDSIEGKAYGYIALNAKNEKMRESFYKYAVKCFENANSRGYHDALLDLADLQKKLYNPYVGETTAFRALATGTETYTVLGELFYDFSALAESAARVMEGKRPLISNIMDFKYAMWKYEDGAKTSINSKLYHGLALIIYNEDDSKQEGLKIVKDTINEFKKANEECNKVLFDSDAKRFKENISIVENRILKTKKR